MIVIYHQNNKATQVQVWHETSSQDLDFKQAAVTNLLFEVAKKYPQELIIWCDETFRDCLNLTAIPRIFHHKRMMASFHPNGNYLPEAIGYVEESSFIKINKEVTFPTWRMSGIVGGIHAEAILAAVELEKCADFGYFLNSFAKRAMPLGLFCYSEPKLLTGILPEFAQKAGNGELFRFVKQHYKPVWILLMAVDLWIYEKKFPLLSAAFSLSYKRRNVKNMAFTQIEIDSRKTMDLGESVDVVIPTFGRKPYLYNVLKDLSRQTTLPSKIIIVEQNPEPESVSQLTYLEDEKWPFPIKHLFIHQSGACNARNLALDEVESDWIFLADDDIRMETSFLESAFKKILEYNNQVFNFSCLHAGQAAAFKTVHQTSIFGSGCSIISKESLGGSRFDMGFEFGFSEDLDFARQLMDKGFDTYYIPDPALLHLKAPVGGFRARPKLMWANENIQPKPSPTVMLYKLKHHSKEQLLGYKMVLFFKFYGGQSIKNPFRYAKNFRRMWNSSVFWANRLRNAI